METTRLETQVLEQAEEIARLKLQINRMAGTEGHDEPCYYCNQACNALAGDPAQWPIPLTHDDAPGVVKWHHIGCVMKRVEALDYIDDHGRALSFMETLKAQQVELEMWKKSFSELDRRVQNEIFPEIERLTEDRKVGWGIISNQAGQINCLTASNEKLTKRLDQACAKATFKEWERNQKSIQELIEALEKYLPTDVRSIMLRPAMYRDCDRAVAEKIQIIRETTLSGQQTGKEG